MNAVAASGRAAGYRQIGGIRNQYVMDYPPSPGTAFHFNGLAGTMAGEVFSISLDGSIVFGHSPTTAPLNRPGRWPYKAVLTTAVPGSPGSRVSICELPRFPDTTGAGGNAGVPYACTADGRYAAGMSYRGTERAVLWDTGDPDPSKWSVLDLTSLAEANRITGIFLSLRRAYGVATNAAGDLVITGFGVDKNLPANTRAFVMTITPPIAPMGFPPTVTMSGSYPGSYWFSFLSVTGAVGKISNFLEYTTELAPASWSVITSAESTGGPITLVDPDPIDEQRFYRIRMQ